MQCGWVLQEVLNLFRPQRMRLYLYTHKHTRIQCKHVRIYVRRSFMSMSLKQPTCTLDWNPTRATRRTWSLLSCSRFLSRSPASPPPLPRCWRCSDSSSTLSWVRRPSFSSSSRLRLNHRRQHYRIEVIHSLHNSTG